MMQINFKNFGMNMSFLFTMARELFAGLLEDDAPRDPRLQFTKARP